MEGVLILCFPCGFVPSVWEAVTKIVIFAMAIQFVTGMALNLGGLHSVYEKGAKGFDVAGYQQIMTHPQYLAMK
jgi:hypothetical protein